MRCHEVIHELAVPTDDRDQAAIDEHLARCASCAGWLERANGLDRLWKATQPPDPAPLVWDAVWSNVAASLDIAQEKEIKSPALLRFSHGSPAPQPKLILGRPAGSRYRTLAVIGLIGLAQAAAVVLAVGLTWNTSNPSRPGPITSGTNPPGPTVLAQPLNVVVNHLATFDGTVDIEAGQTIVVVIRKQGNQSAVIDRSPSLTVSEVDDWYLMHSAMESLPTPKVAMKE